MNQCVLFVGGMATAVVTCTPDLSTVLSWFIWSDQSTGVKTKRNSRWKFRCFTLRSLYTWCFRCFQIWLLYLAFVSYEKNINHDSYEEYSDRNEFFTVRNVQHMKSIAWALLNLTFSHNVIPIYSLKALLTIASKGCSILFTLQCWDQYRIEFFFIFPAKS